MKKAIVIGASSGIGKEIARELSNAGYAVGIASRRTDLLETLKKELKTTVYIRKIDISKQEEAMDVLEGLIKDLGGIDLIVISSGIGYINTDLDWDKEKQTIDVNVSGFASLANISFKYFLKQGDGCLAVLSSVAALRGSSEAPAYNASKSFVSNYLEGLRCKARKLNANIKIIDVRPGLVDTAMAQGEGLFWVAPPQKAARQIVKAIDKGKRKVYVTKRWALIAWVLKIIPERLYSKLN